MQPLGIVEEPLDTRMYGITREQHRYSLLLALRRRARQALDRILSAPRAVGGFLGRLAQHRLVRRLTGAAAALLGRLAPLTRAVRSIGFVPLGLVAATSPSVQRLAGRALRLTGQLLGRIAHGLVGAVNRALRACGARGAQLAEALRISAQKAAQAVRTAAAPMLPSLRAAASILAVAGDVARPLVRGLLVHRVLTRLVPSRLLRTALELLVAPALVDGRVGSWLRATTARVVSTVEQAVLRHTVVVVVDSSQDMPMKAATVVIDESESESESKDEPAPSNRAERREAQRQQTRRQARTA